MPIQQQPPPPPTKKMLPQETCSKYSSFSKHFTFSPTRIDKKGRTGTRQLVPFKRTVLFNFEHRIHSHSHTCKGQQVLNLIYIFLFTIS